MTQKKKSPAQYSALAGIHRAVPIILFAFAVFTMFCFITQDIGALGHAISALFLGLFSHGAYAIPLLLAVHAIFYPSDIAEKRLLSRVIFSLIAIVFISALSYSITYWNEGFVFNAVSFFKDGKNAIGGGLIGGTVGFCIIQIVGRVGLVIIAAAILSIYVSYFFAGGQKGLATVFYLFFRAILSILTFFEKMFKGAHRKARTSKEEKAKRNTDLKNLELTDDEYFDVDNGMRKLSVSALGIRVTRDESGVGTATTLHDKVFHKSAVSDEEAKKMEMREKAEEFYYANASFVDDYEQTASTARHSASFNYYEAEPEAEPKKQEAPKADAPVKEKDASADSVFTGTFDPFGMAMSEKLASKPSSRSLLDENEGRAKVREDVRELTPEEIEREKRVLEFERRKAAVVGARRPTPVENDGEFKGTPKNVDFRERTSESMDVAPKETATSSFVFNKTERVYEAPKAEPANYTSIGLGDVSESFSTVVNKSPYTPKESVYSAPKQESYAPKNSYTEPVNESVPTSTPYVEEEATPLFTKKAEPAHTVYSGENATSSRVYERVSKPTEPSYEPKAAYSMEHSDDADEIFSFSIGKSGSTPTEKPAYEAYSTREPEKVIASDEPVFRTGYYTEKPSEPEHKEFVPEFKPYQAASEEDMSADEVTVIDLKETVAEPARTITLERERVVDDEIYEAPFGEDEDEEEDEIVEEMPPEEEDSSFEEEEIPPEEQNPVVREYKDMFAPLRDAEEETEDASENEDEPTYEAEEEEVEPEEAEEDEDEEMPPFEHNRVKPEPKPKKAEEKAEKKKPDFSNYKKPPIDLLGLDPVIEDDTSEINENTKTLIDTLASFNVTASIKGVDRGPRITRYEVVPARGVKVNSITTLFNDIKLNLGKEGVRMEAPIPGKSAIGFEIPNAKPKTVRLRELIECEDFSSPKASDTFVAIGKDVSGNPVFGDICKYPHALICGATGMGKSVCINSILVSMLYRAHPKEVKLIMIDPKKVEFKMYSGIPHLLIPVITESKQAAGALMWAVEEMERRYELIETHCVRNIEAYNEKVAYNPSIGEPLPKIIIVIDELADLMMQVRDPVEDLIMRIAQKARAAGIHLIIGTQRPSTNIITGSIKANIPSRFSCKVTSQVDSRTIFDTKGAEELLNKGDMLYWPVDRSSALRVQGAFVSDKEVEDVMQFLKDQVTENVYDDEVFSEINKAAQKCGNKKSGAGAADDEDDGDTDECGYYGDQQFLDAVELAIRSGKVSTSLLQRKLSIGYGKAAKYIDQMEDIGIVSEPKGQKPRDVLVNMDEWHEKLSRVEY